MIVDSHVHLFPPEVGREPEVYRRVDPWFRALYERPDCVFTSVDDLLRSMDQAAVDYSVVCGFPWLSQRDCQRHNDYFAELANLHGERLIFLASVQPRAEQVAVDSLALALSSGLRGWGEVNPDGQAFALDEHQLLDPLMDVLLQASAPLLLHCSEPAGHLYPGKGSTTPDKLYPFARRYAANTLLCAHWGGGLPLYYLMPELSRELPNVYYDTAATQYLYQKRIFPIAGDIVGTDRILMGSDYPLLSQAKTLSHVRASGLEEAEMKLVTGNNAARLFDLRRPE